MIQSKWIWPSVIISSGVLAGSLTLGNTSIWLRPLAGLWFLLVCPGMAFVRLLPIKETHVRWTLAIALSLTLDALVASILIYAHQWSPNAALVILIVTSLAGVGLQVRAIGKNKILLIENDAFYSTAVSNFMRAKGYEIQGIQSLDEALKNLAESTPDMIIFDHQPADYDKWDALYRLRNLSSKPIVILTTHLEEADIMRGFQFGADDFMNKSVSFSKFESRVTAILSKTKSIHKSEMFVKSNELAIDFVRKEVKTKKGNVNLSPTEFKLLEVLAQNANRTIPTNRLVSEVWGLTKELDKHALRRSIRSLRLKIEKNPNRPVHIITRRGYGYRFE